MATYILAWNHTKWEWDDFDAALCTVQSGEPLPDSWSTGNNRQLQPDDQFFLLRQHDHQGIIGSGIVTSVVDQREHWDGSDRKSNYVDVEFQHLVSADDVLGVDALEIAMPAVRWRRLQGSGITVPADQEQTLERLWLDHLEKLGLAPVELPGEVVDPDRFVEGATYQIWANAYERNPAARRACIAHYGTACVVCGFNFGKVFGELGKGYIHVHHLLDLASIGTEYEVDPIGDLRPVCPNCHEMLHRETPAMSIEKLKTVLNRHSNQNSVSLSPSVPIPS
jgi:5-methylcytosine-specific restriction enzyme A